ncbi:YgeY family selenium metabolism-linked hydrolase [Mesorhizobium sp. A623]
MVVDFHRVKELSEFYREDIAQFLRDMVAIPSESCNEGAIVERIRAEMEKVGFDRVEIDPMGNILGYIGNGNRLIALDAHIDTVGVGDLANWDSDPYEGYDDKDIVYGRGTSDQAGGMAAMVYAGKIIKELGLDEGYTLVCTGTVQEEDCDGLCWLYLIQEGGLKPEFVVSTEPTNCNVALGHRGRMEIKVEVRGISSHGAMPHLGDNAILKMAAVLTDLEELAERLPTDDVLGKGTLTVSEIFSGSPSRCAVADRCWISIDRRLTKGETLEQSLEEIRSLPSVQQSKAEVSLYDYAKASWTGLVYPTECYFPAWRIEQDHPACQALVKTHEEIFGETPNIGVWNFSTNGVAIMGRHGIPCIGFGPGKEEQAHAPNEITWKDHLVRATAVYATLPSVYVSTTSGSTNAK